MNHISNFSRYMNTPKTIWTQGSFAKFEYYGSSLQGFPISLTLICQLRFLTLNLKVHKVHKKEPLKVTIKNDVLQYKYLMIGSIQYISIDDWWVSMTSFFCRHYKLLPSEGLFRWLAPFYNIMWQFNYIKAFDSIFLRIFIFYWYWYH